MNSEVADIQYEAFLLEILLLETIMKCVFHYSIDRWLVPPKPKPPPPRSLLGKLSALCPYQLSRPYMKNNYVYLIFLAFFVFVNIGLFVSRSIQYRASGGFVIVARACGKLQWNCWDIFPLSLWLAKLLFCWVCVLVLQDSA
jgi:hypothetical protein